MRRVIGLRSAHDDVRLDRSSSDGYKLGTWYEYPMGYVD